MTGRTISTDDPRALDVVAAIQSGDVATLQRLLHENPELAATGIERGRTDDAAGMTRSLLHIATDWPGHFPNGVTVAPVSGSPRRWG